LTAHADEGVGARRCRRRQWIPAEGHGSEGPGGRAPGGRGLDSAAGSAGGSPRSWRAIAHSLSRPLATSRLSRSGETPTSDSVRVAGGGDRAERAPRRQADLAEIPAGTELAELHAVLLDVGGASTTRWKPTPCWPCVATAAGRTDLLHPIGDLPQVGVRQAREQRHRAERFAISASSIAVELTPAGEQGT
jgi:hypothetical protein